MRLLLSIKHGQTKQCFFVPSHSDKKVEEQLR